MEIGLFMVPFRLPETDFRAGFEWDMQVLEWADEFGLAEVWVGEHTTLAWEPIPSPEMYLAAAVRRTERIRLATGANLVPNHNPVALAHRLMLLDHMSEGRLMVGVGAGAYPSDAQIHGSKDTHEMMVEAVEIILSVWNADGHPFRYEGKYWTVDYPAFDPFLRGPHWRPYQKPHPPLAMAGLSPASGTLKEAGARGYIPLSFNVGREYLAGHWYRYVEGCEEAGRVPDRNQWRVAHNVFVADTDEEALELALSGGMGRTYREWMLPSYAMANMVSIMAPEVENQEDVTPEWLAENKWLVGSPDTVVEKLQRDLEVSGGFGTLIAFTFDYLDNPAAYRRHLELLGTEVLPRIQNLTHASQPLSELPPPPETAAIALGPQQ
jgi:alkanesulfonate monooxygenase SsuD/methylene tetrahydromethanopterin reductase-like flavin-dependent oxidoreductase (luciferase family)